MKTLLICPDQRLGIAALAEAAPLSNIPILGKSLVEYWVEHLATLGAREVLVLATDRPEQVRTQVGNGARWGLRASVIPEKNELTLAEARRKHQADLAAWLAAPNDVIAMNHLPGLPQHPLVNSYADWFAGVRALLPRALTPDRIGVRELKPGVWVGLNAHVPSGAKITGPCWIGERVWIEAGATIGPNTVLEREVFIGRGAEVSHSLIGPETFVGQFTEIRNSIAWGSTLINWERDSCLRVPDAFLLCSRESQRVSPAPAPAPATPRHREFVSESPTSPIGEFGPPR